MNYIRLFIFLGCLLFPLNAPVEAVNNYNQRMGVIVKNYQDKFPSASRDVPTLNVVSRESCLNTVKALHSNARSKSRNVDVSLPVKSEALCNQTAITSRDLEILGRGKSNNEIWVRTICLGINVGANIFKTSDVKQNNEKVVGDSVEDWAEEVTLVLCPKYLDAITGNSKK
jgi:hypothetical protein